MYRESMTGLGDLLLTTPTGVRFHSSTATPSCITRAEWEEANQKCPTQQIRGLGAGPRALAPMSGRLSYYSPCALADLPVCPAPQCLDDSTVNFIVSCIENPTGPNCGQVPPLAMYALSRLPFCAGAGGLPPVPSCYPEGMIALRDYCVSTNGAGGNKGWNAGCWRSMHDPAYWARVLAVPACSPTRTPPRLNPVVTHTPDMTAQSIPDDAQEDLYPPDAQEDLYPPGGQEDLPPESESEQSEASTAGMWGILALIAVAGGGYYMYRRSKR